MLLLDLLDRDAGRSRPEFICVQAFREYAGRAAPGAADTIAARGFPMRPGRLAALETLPWQTRIHCSLPPP